MKKVLVLLIAVVLAVTATPATHATTANEKDACRRDSYNYSYVAPVKRKGKKYKNFGYIVLKERESPSDSDNRRWCTYLRYGKDTFGKKRKSMIKIGSREQGSTSNPITWRYQDKGWYKYRAGGVAMTPGEGRCPAVKGWIKHKGKTYTAVINGNLTCN